MSRIDRIRTLAALGPGNLARVAAYRLGLKSGLHPVLRIAAEVPAGPFFAGPPSRVDLPAANHEWDDALVRFDWHRQPVPADGAAPDWFANPFADGARAEAALPWWRIGDFAGGDIKGVWELSRFGWVVAAATRAVQGDAAQLDRLNTWLADWASANPPYRGANWKCGQEASIRVLHLLLAALVLGQDDAPTSGLVDLVALHLQRIAPTTSYAIGQANNHGTSEGAALFVGGAFLTGQGDARGAGWCAAGRRLLEDRANALIERDGSFSQYSLVYHRVMLDAYVLAEALRRRWNLSAFSARLNDRLRAATDWLAAMIDHGTGDGPNLGANDGARLTPLTGGGYRDFRPTLQAAAALFRGERAIVGAGPWDNHVVWLGIDVPTAPMPSPASATFDDGGYHVLRAGDAIAMLRYPRFRFRPSQADALHLDLTVRGENVLRDAGTFSYNDPDDSYIWFGGTSAHNTPQFDRRDQMPRLGRFLFGSWLKARDVAPVTTGENGVRAAAGYRDAVGAEHHRTVTLSADRLICDDILTGRADTATLRWRLAPGDWRIDGDRVTNGQVEIAVAADRPIAALTLVDSRESRHYLRATPLPVLEITVAVPATLITTIRF